MEIYFVFACVSLVVIGVYYAWYKIKNHRCRHVYYPIARIKGDGSLDMTYDYVCVKCGKVVGINL